MKFSLVYLYTPDDTLLVQNIKSILGKLFNVVKSPSDTLHCQVRTNM